MQSTTTYRRGDIVLVPFPFTDLSGVKNRPALVVSSNSYNSSTTDLMIAQITGNVHSSREGDHTLADWRGAGLAAPSVVRAKIATLASHRVRRAIGRMAGSDLTAVESNLRATLQL